MLNQTLSHYRIVEQIGAGGMGVVYRARDEQLERDVAIKVLPPGALADDLARKRFRKEALSLARLNHPNIATVHEFGSQGDVDFLVTEYIPGLTLDAKLARGALSTKEIIDLGLQLMHGLGAAHEQGLVHRDLKPANLRITPDGRLKILDFGLAQLTPHASEQGQTATLTKSEEVTGTLPYMAPEQLRGEVTDARSDIWSAGAVLYEMACGKRPFVQSNQPLLINAILNQSPDPPRTKDGAGIPPGLQQIIFKALDKDPGHRYQSARELAVDLERLSVGSLPAVTQQSFPQSDPQPFTPQTASSKLYLFAGAIALLLALAIAGYFLVHRNQQSASIASPRNHRRSVAVLGFKNLAGKPEQAWLSTALSEMLTTELSQGDELRTVPGESVAQMKRSLALPDADSFSQETLTRIRENLGTDDVVVGSYIPLADGVIRFDLRLQETGLGEILASVSEKGSASQIDELVSKAGAELRAKLGVAALSDAESASVRATLPSNPEAAQLYSEGLEKLRLFDALAARTLLEKAAALDPKHAPTHSALADAWSILGYDEKAEQQAKQALDLSSTFSREDRLLIEGQYRSLTKDWPGAMSSYRTLWEFFPDRVDYGLLMVRAQIRADHANDAIATIAELRKLSLSRGEIARVDLAEATVAAARTDYKLQQSAAEKAAQEGIAIGANLFVAGALREEGGASQRMGQQEKSQALIEQARGLYTAAGDRDGAAVCLLLTGDSIYDEGHFEQARKLFEQALPVFQETADQRHLRGTMERIGNSYYDQGNLLVAKGYYERALRIDLDLKETSNLASDYGNIANALDALGDLAGSRTMQEQSLAIFEKSTERRGEATTLGNLGGLMVEMGDPEGAKKYFERALSIMREISFRVGEPYPTAGLADAMLMEGDVPGARQQYEAALKLSQDAHQDDHVAQVQTALARVALEQKRFSDGEVLARGAMATFDKDNVADNGAWARAILARNLLGEGKLPEAQTLTAQALVLARQSVSLPQHFEATLADVRTKATAGNTSEAEKELDAMLLSTRKSGYRAFEFEARLAQAEIELQSHSPLARPHLATLEKDARDHNLLLVANHAAALSQGK
jgi:serine/threonine protein kinase/tetratricopeptide (TPR) repeat protein